MDFLGFTSFAMYSPFHDKETGFKPSWKSLGTSLASSRFPSQDSEPRMVGDINGDGFTDLIGFESD